MISTADLKSEEIKPAMDLIRGCPETPEALWALAVHMCTGSNILRLIGRIEGDYLGDRNRQRGLEWEWFKQRAYVYLWGVAILNARTIDEARKNAKLNVNNRSLTRELASEHWGNDYDFNWFPPFVRIILDRTMTTAEAVQRLTDAAGKIKDVLTTYGNPGQEANVQMKISPNGWLTFSPSD